MDRAIPLKETNMQRYRDQKVHTAVLGEPLSNEGAAGQNGFARMQEASPQLQEAAEASEGFEAAIGESGSGEKTDGTSAGLARKELRR